MDAEYTRLYNYFYNKIKKNDNGKYTESAELKATYFAIQILILIHLSKYRKGWIYDTFYTLENYECLLEIEELYPNLSSFILNRLNKNPLVLVYNNRYKLPDIVKKYFYSNKITLDEHYKYEIAIGKILGYPCNNYAKNTCSNKRLEYEPYRYNSLIFDFELKRNNNKDEGYGTQLFAYTCDDIKNDKILYILNYAIKYYNNMHQLLDLCKILDKYTILMSIDYIPINNRKYFINPFTISHINKPIQNLNKNSKEYRKIADYFDKFEKIYDKYKSNIKSLNRALTSAKF